MWWMAVGVLLSAIIILLFIRMPIEILYAVSAKYQKQAFRVKICGIEVFREKDDDSKKKKEKTEKEESANKEKKKFGFDEFMDLLDKVCAIIKKVNEGIVKILSYLGRKTHCSKFIIHLDLGFEDAAQTGVASGAAYGTVYSTASMVYNNIKMDIEDLDIEVNPHFDKPCASLYIKGIFRLSAAHIIRVAFMALGVAKDVYKILNNKNKK